MWLRELKFGVHNYSIRAEGQVLFNDIIADKLNGTNISEILLYDLRISDNTILINTLQSDFKNSTNNASFTGSDLL